MNFFKEELDYYKNKLEEAEKKLRIIGDFSMDSGYWISDKGELLYQSPSIKILTGHDPEEFVENHPYLYESLIHPEDREIFLNHFLDKEGIGEPKSISYRIIDKYGNTKWVETLSNRVFDESGKYLGIRGSTRDITSTKLKDIEIAEERKKYKFISEVISDWVYSIKIDESGEFVEEWVSKAYQRITGDTDVNNVKPAKWLDMVHPDDLEIAAERQQKLFAEGITSIDEYRIINRNQQLLWVKDYGYPIVNSKNGKVERVVGAVQDITELKNAEEKLKKSLKEKEILLTEIHHRVKNNLSMIISLLNLQLDSSGDNNFEDLVLQMENQINSILIIHEKLYQGDDLSTIDFREYVTDLIQYIIVSFSAFDIALSIDIGNIFLDLNKSLPIGLIINELTINAIKHGFKNDGSKTLSVAMMEKEDSYYLEFRNSGYNSSCSDDSDTLYNSIGMQLVYLLTEQMAAEIEISGTDCFEASLKIPK